MSKANTPFRYDFVGSFLRPAELKQARADFQAGKIGADELKAAEDAAIRALVAKQKAAGYHVITDGEFRRATWHLDFMWGFRGVGHHPTEKGLPFQGEAAMLDDTSKALEIDPLQGAMSSIALCVCGIITSILAMFFTA